MVVGVVKALRRCWLAGLLALGSCNAYPPKREASSPGASAAAPAAVPGASDPAECKDEVPPLDAVQQPVVSDEMLAPLAPCMKKLASVGTINVSFIVSEVGAIERVNVGGSTVDDCRAVACVKAGLSKLRVAVPEPAYPTSHHTSLKLFPRTSPRRLNEGEPAPLKSEAKFCADPEDAEVVLSRLKPEVIQSAVRARYDRFRRCYEAGLAVNPTLTGRVSTRFIIGRDGRVSGAYTQDTTLPDCRVTQCVRDEIAKIVFPEPKFGIVTVSYPIMFAPGGPPK